MIFGESEIILKLEGAQIQVQEITLILNADRSELDNARSSNKGFEAIGSTGNFIRSKTLPLAHTEWELILSKEHKISLMALNDDRIKLVPKFESRPLILQSPLSIFNAIAHLVRGH